MSCVTADGKDNTPSSPLSLPLSHRPPWYLSVCCLRTCVPLHLRDLRTCKPLSACICAICALLDGWLWLWMLWVIRVISHFLACLDLWRAVWLWKGGLCVTADLRICGSAGIGERGEGRGTRGGLRVDRTASGPQDAGARGLNAVML